MAKRYKLTHFAFWINKEIGDLGITKQQFCDEAGIAMGMLFRYYTAQQLPKLPTYIKICTALARLNDGYLESYVVAGIDKIMIDIDNQIK